MLSNLIYIITGILGLITVFIIFTNYKSNVIMNLYIIVLLLIISIRFFFMGLVFFVEWDSSESYLKFSNLSIIVIPICYLYFKTLDENNKTVNQKHFYHFIFPISFFLFVNSSLYTKFASTQLNIVLCLLFIAFSITYIGWSYNILKSKIWGIGGAVKMVQQQNKLIKNWTLFLFFGLILTISRLLIAIGLEIYLNKEINGQSYQWISAIIWSILILKILISPEILYGFNAMQDKIKQNTNATLVFTTIWNLSPEGKGENIQHKLLEQKINPNIINYITQIEAAAVEFELFRNANVTITSLAESLQIPKSHLLYVFKYHCKMSFSDFKKTIRIQDAMQQIDLHYLKSNTLDSLSKKVGFTSYNPFFTSFKEIAGISPVDYLKMKKSNS